MGYLKIIVLICIITLAVITDKKSYKIKNQYLIIGSLIGLTFNSICCGKEGLITSILGFIIPIVIFFLLFALRMIGAGDIKLYATIGAIMGLEFVLYSILYSLIIGAIGSLLIMIKRRILITRLKCFVKYIYNIVVTGKIDSYYNLELDGYEGVIHFTYFIALGVLIYLIKIYFLNDIQLVL